MVQDMLHHAQNPHIHKVMLTQMTSCMTVEALTQWASEMRMIGFTVPSAKTMARSRADIVNAIVDCDKPSMSPPANVEGPAGVVHLGHPGADRALRPGQIQDSEPPAPSSMEYAPAKGTELGSVLVEYDAGVGAMRTRRKMHKRWSKLALRASLPKRIRRALISVMDNHADSKVTAVRGVVADKIGVPLDGKYGWVLHKVFLKLTAVPEKEAQASEGFCPGS